jgi:hypothetical protein
MSVPVAIPVATDRVLISFTGEGAGVGELSWGQREIWQAMVHQRGSLAIGGRKPLPPGTTVEDVAEELRYLMTRYPSMRTRLRFGPDGRPTQEVLAAGEIALEVFDVPDGDPEEVAAVVSDHYRFTPFDYTDDWLIRMAVTRQHGLATHMIVLICHLVTDAGGAMVMFREVEARETGPVAGLQPLEQARWQATAAGQRQNARTLRYWADVLRSIPTRQLPDSTDRRTPRHWQGEFRSPALPLAVRAVAERTGADSTAVLMVLFAVALARITGIDPVVVRPVVHNRFRAVYTDVLCMAAQAGICAVEVADSTVDEVVGRAERATRSAYKHAYFDPEQLNALIATVAAERGPDFDVACFFNDRRVKDGDAAASPEAGAPTPEQLHAASGKSTFDWTVRQDDPVERLFLHFDDVPDGMQITVCADTHYLSPPDVEALVWGIEAVAVEAAFDPDAPTGVTAR